MLIQIINKPATILAELSKHKACIETESRSFAQVSKAMVEVRLP